MTRDADDPAESSQDATSRRDRRRRTGCVAALAAAAALVGLAIGGGVAARRAQRAELDRLDCMSDLKQIGVATHNFHDVHAHLPPRRSIDGEPIEPISWRVELLPYLEQQALFDEYDPSQSWDAPANRGVAESMPERFACPSHARRSEPNRTTYFAVSGDETMFDGSRRVGFSDAFDGLANTILYVESNEHDVVWTEPRDIPFSELAGVRRPDESARPRSDHRHVLYGDASIRTISSDIDPEVYRALMTRAGGESISPP